MADTEFRDFAQDLAVSFQGDRTPEDFAKWLFKEIYLPTSNDDPVEELLPRTYKSYFYGDTDVSTLAKKMTDSLDPDNFAAAITTETDATIKRICDQFSGRCEGIDETNYAHKVAEYFQGLIERAARPKTRKTKKERRPSTASPKEKFGSFLVAEAGSICPNDGCTKPLFSSEGGHTGLVFDVAVIDPEKPSDQIGNLIALCPECCAKYVLKHDASSVSRMKSIKEGLQASNEDLELLSEQTVQDGIRKVLEKIPSLPKPGNVDLNYNPVPLRNKIEEDNVSLYIKTQAYVNVYFPIVHETFQEMGREGLLRFMPFCQQVKLSYLELREQGRDQNRVFSEMTDWLHNATGEDRDSCEIVIAYFIQKCEVFDVITE